MSNNNQSISNEHFFVSWNGDISEELQLMVIQGKESLSSTYKYLLQSITNKTEDDIISWHGKSVSCTIGNDLHALPKRFIHGVITSVCYKQNSESTAECFFTIEPSLALLKLGRSMRVWQDISVPDIVNTLFKEHDINHLELHLLNEYSKREYCIQYRESDFDFIQRILEEEGIYYFFRHGRNEHYLILTDHPSVHIDSAGEEMVWHHDGNIMSMGCVHNWVSTTNLLPTSVTLLGFNTQQNEPIAIQQRSNCVSKLSDSINFTDLTIQDEREPVSRQVENTIAALEANSACIQASVNAHWLSSGETFKLKGHPSGDETYRVHSLDIEASNNIGSENGSFFCQITAMSNSRPWFPVPKFLSPTISGILTAFVVGPSSEDVYTDKYGRIKIQFPWDRDNRSKDAVSCWVRVMQPWGGNRFGIQFIPRVGSEVIVSFEQGNPDRPIVMGNVYNGQNLPPLELPTKKMESGLVTRSLPNGTVNEANSFIFNDKKNDELLAIIAEKDLSLKVKNEMSSLISSNRKTIIKNGSDDLSIEDGDINITLKRGNVKNKIKGGVSTELKNGDYHLDVTGGNVSIKTDNSLVLESIKTIEFKVGSNKISISASGITISGTTVKIEGSATAELKGAMATLSGSGMTRISGGIVNIG